MDPLVELPFNLWHELQEKLLRDWPRNIAGYYALKKNIQHPKLRDAFKLKVYCPFGDMDNGFVVISMRGNLTTIVMSPITEDTSKLEEALSKSLVIDWSAEVSMKDISAEAFAVVTRLKPVLGLNFIEEGVVKMFYLDRRTKPFEDLCLPDEITVKQVKQEDIARVCETWFEEFSVSFNFFSNLSNNGFSYGLYSRSKLLAWLFTSEHDVLQHLFCEKEYRRQGYGECILKFVINEQLKQGNDVYCFAKVTNHRSVELLKKVGFEIVKDFYYAAVKKH